MEYTVIQQRTFRVEANNENTAMNKMKNMWGDVYLSDAESGIKLTNISMMLLDNNDMEQCDNNNIEDINYLTINSGNDGELYVYFTTNKPCMVLRTEGTKKLPLVIRNEGIPHAGKLIGAKYDKSNGEIIVRLSE